MKKKLLIVLKVLLVLSILSYLLVSKKLDLSSLSIYLHDPMMILVNVSIWLFGCCILTSYRWNLVLKGMNLSIPFKRVMHLNLVGFFFNTIAPGAVGGDLVKAYYLFREQESGKRTPAMLAIFLDRVLGLYAVFIIAAFSVFAFYSHFTESKMLSTIALIAVGGFSAMTLVFTFLFFSRSPAENNIIYRFLNRPYPGFSFLQKIFLSFFLLKQNPGYFFKAVFIGVLFQLSYMGFYCFVTLRLGHTFSYPDFAAIFPVGFLISALPIAPGGLGVGHLAFDQLFNIIGIDKGANIYNCIFLGQTFMNLLGLFPYLLLKKKR